MPILKLLASKNESLLIGRNPFLVLDIGFNTRPWKWLSYQWNLKSCRKFTCQHINEEQGERVDSWMLWSDRVLARPSSSCFPRRRRSGVCHVSGQVHLVLDLKPWGYWYIIWLEFQSGLAREGLNKNLHASTKIWRIKWSVNSFWSSRSSRPQLPAEIKSC